MRKFIKVLLFLSAYVPLIILFSVRFVNNYRYFTISGVIISIILTIILLRVVKATRQLPIESIVLSNVNYKSSDLLAYMFSYVFSFLEFDLGSYIDLIIILFIFVILAVIYINSNMIYINPMLSVFGYKIYEIISEENDVYVLITKEPKLGVGNSIDVYELGSNVKMGVN
jgi:hypothetical protein